MVSADAGGSTETVRRLEDNKTADTTLRQILAADTSDEGEQMLGKPLLFLSSYAPLFLLLAIRFDQRSLRIACMALSFLGFFALWLLLHLDSQTSLGPHTLTSASDIGSEASAYLATYLLPFLTVSTPSARDIIAYIFYFCIAGIIYVRSSMLQVNPLLYLFRYRVLDIRDDHGLRAYMITKAALEAGDRVLATRLGDTILVDRTPKRVPDDTDG